MLGWGAVKWPPDISCFTPYLQPSAQTEPSKSGACEEEQKSGACFYGGFTPSFHPSDRTILYAPSTPHPPTPHPHMNTSTKAVHALDQRGRRVFVKSIYPDDCVLLLVVHPAIEPFTRRNSVPSVRRCRVCKLPRLLPKSYHHPNTAGSMIRFFLVLSLNTDLASFHVN